MIISVSRKINFHSINFFLISLILVFSAPVIAQRINVQSTTDKKEIVIGEYIQLSLKIYVPKGTTIQYPILQNQQLNAFEVIETGLIDTVFNSNESITLQQSIILTSYDTGINVIPAVRVPYNYKNIYDTASSPSININVSGVAVDLSQDIKDVRPPMDVPFSWREIIPYLFYIISLLVLVGGGVYAWIYYRKNNKQEEVQKPEMIEPAHLIALRQLDTLKYENLIQKKQFREFHSRLTDHLRRYIQSRFKISAMEKTSEDIIFYFKEEALDKKSLEALEQILILSDQVKFAKVKPSEKESEQSLLNAYYFVNNTQVKTAASNEQSG